MMKRPFMLRLAVCLAALVLVNAALPAQSSRSLNGMWQGALSVQGMKLRLVFNLASAAGGYRATMDSPDQGAKGITTDTVIILGDSVRILMRMIGGAYAGVLQPGDSVLSGTWSQSGNIFPLDLKRTTEAVTYRRPQLPSRPFPYAEEEVSVPNRSAGITLAGTLTIPKGPGPHPAVVLITGSGAQDRDETIFQHKPFLVLADDLTRKGVAVLRMDDRGVGKSGGTMAGATSMDFATDISAAVDYVRSRPEINKDRIGLVGHSEGGIIAPLVAVERTDIAFIVLLAGPSISGVDILIQQDSLISLANGETMQTVQSRLAESREMFELLRREPDTSAARTKLEAFLLEKARTRNTAGRPDSVLQQEARRTATRLGGAWMRFFLFYDPMQTLRKVRCPILALNGEKDLQVPHAANLMGIAEAGKAAGNADVTVKMMPGLNHLFQSATTGSPMEYATIEETISPEALALIGEWIGTRAGIEAK